MDGRKIDKILAMPVKRGTAGLAGVGDHYHVIPNFIRNP